MAALVAAAVAGYGVYLVYTAVALGWRGLGVGPQRATAGATPRTAMLAQRWLPPAARPPGA
jgi:hypothetical protein